MKTTPWTLSAAVAVILGAGTTTVPGQDAAPDAGALFQKLDKNGDGKLSADEIPEDQIRFFDRLVRRGDKNADKVLTRDEFDQANKPDERPDIPLADQGRSEEARMEARKRIEMLDRNKDGKISLDEVPAPLRDRLKPAFERSGKQELTIEELLRHAAGGFRPDPAELFKRLDLNSDGKLTRDEIPAERRELIGILDGLGKSEITRDDWIRFMDRARGERRPESNQPTEGERRPREGQPRPEGDRTGDGGRPAENRGAEGRGSALMRLLDANRDGRLSKEELAKAGEMFAELDRNHDGQLDASELFGGPDGRPGPRRDENPREGASTQDSAPRRDSDRPEGRRPEGGQPGREGRPDSRDRAPIFQRLDRDGDGKLSKDEAPEFMKERFNTLDTNGDGVLTLDEFRAGASSFADRPRPRTTERREPEKPTSSKDGDAQKQD